MSGHDKSGGDSTSIAALVVALVALVVALCQLLGQYFSTADGYRRCQSSVMGSWARFTRLRWRWSQFRFETLFTIPMIIVTDKFDEAQHRVEEISTAHDFSSVNGLFVSQIETDDLVCWLPLLGSLARYREVLAERDCHRKFVIISLSSSFWLILKFIFIFIFCSA